MKIKMIALDLDRTTLNRNGRLSDENRKVLTELLNRGIHVIPASGRSLTSFPQEILTLPGLKYVITSNGAAVYRLPEQENRKSGEDSVTNQTEAPVCLQKFLLDPLTVRRVMELTATEDVTYEAFVDGQAYADPAYIADPTAFGAVKEATAYIQSTRVPVADIREFIREHEDRLDSVDVIVGDRKKKEELMQLLREQCPGIYLTTSVEQLIEISDIRAGKHSAVKFLQELLKISPEETAAFGDADNDVEMLREAGMGIAVQNASQACMAAADAVTRSCEDDGVAYGIRKILGLIKAE